MADEGQRPGEVPSELGATALELGHGLGVVVAVVDLEEALDAVDDRQEGRALAVGGTATFEPAVRLSGEPLAELVEHARLADARLADEKDHLAPAATRGLEGAAHAVELAVAPHEGREAAGAGRLDAPAHGPVRSPPPKARTGSALPLIPSSPRSFSSKKPATRLRVASEMRTEPGTASCWSRAARFVVSPTAV